MILVTGTKRSGTSMWMQALSAAGLPWIGERFLGKWADSIEDANPKGFYESPLRQGIFFGTNPDLRTGAFLRPDATRRHVVKVFIPGLIRTDLAYMDHIIATMRPWREYATSIRRLYALEDAYHDTLEGDALARALASVRQGRPRVPAEIEWWFDQYELIRDVSTRQYPLHLTTYHRLLQDPEPELARVLKWVGGGDLKRALEVIDVSLNTQKQHEAPPDPTFLEPAWIEVMDELYDRAHRQQALTPALVQAMNTHHEAIVARWGAPSRDRQREEPSPP